MLFLSCQIIQNKVRGAAIQAFFCLFPTKEPRQERKVSLTDLGNTQLTPKIVKRRAHSNLAIEQCNNKLSTVSSFFPQRKHLLARVLSRFLIDQESTLCPKNLPKQKKTHLGGNPVTPNKLMRKSNRKQPNLNQPQPYREASLKNCPSPASLISIKSSWLGRIL